MDEDIAMPVGAHRRLWVHESDSVPFEAHGGGTVRSIRVQLGPLSGVEPLLLASAWERVRCDATLGEATLEVEEVPLEARCRTCHNEFQPVRFCFRCPRCGGTETDVVRGENVVLRSIVLDDAEEGTAV